MTGTARSSSGHKLGQLVGDWFEEKISYHLLDQVAKELNLFLDSRFKARACRRGKKILWNDLDGNRVDYDFVLELGGNETQKGIPLAFFETFWRRGARHSKDKARDDSGKLGPMRNTYPTARVLGIIAAGDFTHPAQELVRSRGIDLFYIPKKKICEAWASAGINIDYLDNANEMDKALIANHAEAHLSAHLKEKIKQDLLASVGASVFDSYIQRIIAGLAALPMEFHITSFLIGEPVIFTSAEEALNFLKADHRPESAKMNRLFNYQVVFSDGAIFDRSELPPSTAIELHEAVCKVGDYFAKYYEAKKCRQPLA
ncbi:hypothetical protein [Stutzerimonas chloritidismutans]|uniref:hypothetical protein n=1 Tax=Stutzerimonas chloritidismutans TaxID=203192 RepID=UPI0038517023